MFGGQETAKELDSCAYFKWLRGNSILSIFCYELLGVKLLFNQVAYECLC